MLCLDALFLPVLFQGWFPVPGQDTHTPTHAAHNEPYLTAWCSCLLGFPVGQFITGPCGSSLAFQTILEAWETRLFPLCCNTSSYYSGIITSA